jgi:hypothetical protein
MCFSGVAPDLCTKSIFARAVTSTNCTAGPEGVCGWSGKNAGTAVGAHASITPSRSRPGPVWLVKGKRIFYAYRAETGVA